MTCFSSKGVKFEHSEIGGGSHHLFLCSEQIANDLHDGSCSYTTAGCLWHSFAVVIAIAASVKLGCSRGLALTVCVCFAAWKAYMHYCIPISEGLLIVPGLGVELSVEYKSGRVDTTLIERERIVDVLINEAISMWEVFFYLVIVVESAEKIILPFERYCPRLPALVEVYRCAQRSQCMRHVKDSGIGQEQ